MRYTPKEIKDNVNISQTKPLKKLFSLLASITGLLLIAYILLGFAVEIIAPHIPEGIEESLGRLYGAKFINSAAKTEPEIKVQELLNNLAKELPGQKEYKVSIVESEGVNAFALPGRNIVILSGLLDKIESENELSFVLAHELGHFANKDHLRGMGRGLVFFVLSSLFLGQDNPVNEFIGNSLTKAEMKFSQAQEKAADIFALDLLYKKYGHTAGAVEFLGRLKRKEKIPKFLYFFATHPHTQNRIKAIKGKALEKNYSTQESTPLDPSLGKPRLKNQP